MNNAVTFTIALKQHNLNQHIIKDTGIVGAVTRYHHTFLDGTTIQCGSIESIYQACRQKGENMEIDVESVEPVMRTTNNETLTAFPTRIWKNVEEAKQSLGLDTANTNVATRVEYGFLDNKNDCLICTFICDKGRKQANDQHDILVNSWIRQPGVYHSVADQTDWNLL